jgi:small multidrug resistance family-3 protein
METMLRSAILFAVAAVSEIGGAYLIWMWRRTGKPVIWALAGVVALMIYSLIQTLQTFSFGRAFAAYGGIFIVCAMVWGWLVDGHIPDRWDIIGGAICLTGVIVIVSAPRT